MTSTAKVESGTVDLFLVSFSRLYVELDRLETYLSPEDQLRGGCLIDRNRRRCFTAGRGFLREKLGHYLQADPSRIKLIAGQNGKPSLVADSGSPSLRFNISHAGDLLLVAVTRETEVGIDLESVDSSLEFQGVAKRYFSERERIELSALPETERREAFYRGWTRKEAYLKGLGSGFSRHSDSFDVSLDTTSAKILADRAAPEEARRWIVLDVEVPEGYVAALAYRGDEPKVRWAEEFP